MEKDCSLLFTDDTPPYAFNSADIGKCLAVAYERQWPVCAIKTPHYTLSILSHEDYEKVMSDLLFTKLGV